MKEIMKKIDFHALLDAGPAAGAPAPVALTGRELESLVSPVSCDEFVDSHFARASLYVPGQPRKFETLFSWEKLRLALARGQQIKDRRYNITASFAGGEETGSSRPMMEVQHHQVSELLNAGATICITNIHMADPFLARWAQEIRAQLNFNGTVGVNCYVSADGSGLPTHYDKRVATTLQIAGTKRWRFSIKPAMAWPDTNEVYEEGRMGEHVGKLPAELEFREVELSPGDMLCLPAGAWHSARGVGFSLALNLYFQPQNLLNQLMPLLQSFSAANENWRGGTPATTGKIKGAMPATVAAYLRERLDEFHKVALETISSPDALAEPWLNSLTKNPYTGWQPEAMSPIPGVTRDQQFRVAMSSLRFVQVDEKVIVPCENAVLKFPAAFLPLLQRLAACSTSFTIPEVLSWHQDPEVLSPTNITTYLQALYMHGVLKMVPSQAAKA